MIILSHGYKKPQTGDFGDIWFPAMEDNIELMNIHNHNGVNGEKIDAINLTASKITVAAGSLVDQGGGFHRALVTVPSGGLVDNYDIQIKDPTTKDPIGLQIEKLNSTQFYIYTIVVQDYEVFFGV